MWESRSLARRRERVEQWTTAFGERIVPQLAEVVQYASATSGAAASLCGPIATHGTRRCHEESSSARWVGWCGGASERTDCGCDVSQICHPVYGCRGCSAPAPSFKIYMYLARWQRARCSDQFPCAEEQVRRSLLSVVERCHGGARPIRSLLLSPAGTNSISMAACHGMAKGSAARAPH